MAEVTWGRKETIIWPPRKPIYTLGALLLGLIATGLFVYFRFIFALSPVQQFYLPAYIKSTLTGSVPIHIKYRTLLMSDRKHNAWYARDVDVEPGSTPQPDGKHLRLQLSNSARQRGMIFLSQSVPVSLSGISVERYSRITSQIVASLEQGVRPWVKPWDAEHAAGRITRLLRFNGQPYSGINILAASDARAGSLTRR